MSALGHHTRAYKITEKPEYWKCTESLFLIYFSIHFLYEYKKKLSS